MTLNQELIGARCQEIEEALERLERMKGIPKEIFLSDRDLQDIACYRLLIAIEAALNLCYHVAARKFKRVPAEYAECFAILAESGILDPDLTSRLQGMARFRNLLVHLYWRMNYETVYGIIQNRLNDLRQFTKAIAALI
jgi:uncharacterized protein YutE (UPF0331/DUF86 family)